MFVDIPYYWTKYNEGLVKVNGTKPLRLLRASFCTTIVFMIFNALVVIGKRKLLIGRDLREYRKDQSSFY